MFTSNVMMVFWTALSALATLGLLVVAIVDLRLRTGPTHAGRTAGSFGPSLFLRFLHFLVGVLVGSCCVLFITQSYSPKTERKSVAEDELAGPPVITVTPDPEDTNFNIVRLKKPSEHDLKIQFEVAPEWDMVEDGIHVPKDVDGKIWQVNEQDFIVSWASPF